MKETYNLSVPFELGTTIIMRHNGCPTLTPKEQVAGSKDPKTTQPPPYPDSDTRARRRRAQREPRTAVTTAYGRKHGPDPRSRKGAARAALQLMMKPCNY
jgi:hypothetical protein